MPRDWGGSEMVSSDSESSLSSVPGDRSLLTAVDCTSGSNTMEFNSLVVVKVVVKVVVSSEVAATATGRSRLMESWWCPVMIIGTDTVSAVDSGEASIRDVDVEDSANKRSNLSN